MAAYDLTAIGSPLTIDSDPDTSGEGVSTCKIDDTHFIAFWGHSASNIGSGYAQVFTVNPTTKAVTAEGSPLSFNGGYLKQVTLHSCAKIDSNHFINFYSGIDSDGYVEVFEVNLSTWAVTSKSSLEYLNNSGISSNSCQQIDANHFINFYGDIYTTYGTAQVIEVNLSTWALTSKSTATFSNRRIGYCSSAKIDSNHFVNFYADMYNGSPRFGYANIFEVNLSTWGITVGTRFTFRESGVTDNSCFMVDATRVINFWGYGGSGVQVFNLDVSTLTITANNVTLSASKGFNACAKLDNNHFVRFYGYPSGGGQVYEVNLSTFDVTAVGAAVSKSASQFGGNACSIVSGNDFINFWQGNDEYVQVFSVESQASGPANLKTYNTNLKANIKTINTNPIANVKSLNTNV